MFSKRHISLHDTPAWRLAFNDGDRNAKENSNEWHVLCILSAKIRSPESCVVVVGHVGTIKKTKATCLHLCVLC